VHEKALPLDPAVRDGHVALTGELGDRLRDGFVEASVERPELVGRDRGFQLHGQAGYHLAHVAVAVDDLAERETGLPQLAPVQQGASGHLRTGRARRGLLLASERLRELVEEEGHPVLHLRFGGRRVIPRRDPLAGAGDDLFPVEAQEFVQHRRLR
jgi:hypothetical protein